VNRDRGTDDERCYVRNRGTGIEDHAVGKCTEYAARNCAGFIRDAIPSELLLRRQAAYRTQKMIARY
jgi:hypothetical protein